MIGLPTDILVEISSHCDAVSRIMLWGTSRRLNQYIGAGGADCLENFGSDCGLDILKWAYQHGWRYNGSACDYAAGVGRLDVLRWARSLGATWNEQTLIYAAKGGYLDILSWLHKMGCGWRRDTIIQAIMCNYRGPASVHRDITIWAAQNGQTNYHVVQKI